MKLADIPVKQPIVWASAAGGGFVSTIPQTPGPTPGAAAYSTGFPPLNFTPIEAGGIPPFGADFNGIMKDETSWLRWFQAGGGVPYFDAGFAAAVGGYPKGAMLQSATTPGTFWISLSDDNVNDPDATPTNWLSFPGTSIIAPSRIVTSSATLAVNADTDSVIYLRRTTGVTAMQVNMAASGTLKTNQPFEIHDLGFNFNSAKVTVTLPNTHVFPNGQSSVVLNQNGQYALFRYAGVSGGVNLWNVKL